MDHPCGELTRRGSAHHLYVTPPGNFPAHIAATGHRVSSGATVSNYHVPGTYTLKDMTAFGIGIDDRTYDVSIVRPDNQATMTVNADGSGTFAAKGSAWSTASR